ncbi:MAG: radical SAM protein [Bacteroidota bacterium]|nr:radical SAM protein [Bacteroidota bacterium]
MKVFLVYVRDEDYYNLLPQKLSKSRDDGRVEVMAFPPLGIQTLAPVLRKHGHDVHMFDTCHPEMKETDIAKAVIEESPDIISLSFLSTTSYPALKSMARHLKKTTPDIPIITGGPFATANSVEILNDSPDIDFVGVGEGEELLPDFLDKLDDPASVKGIAWRSNGKVVKNPPRPLIMDLDQFPYPDRQSLPIEFIESMPLDVPAVLSLDRFCTIQTSRGCPFNCIYCDIPQISQGKWRNRSPEHVLGEMQELNDLGYRSIYLTDDHFLMKRKRIEAICQGIIDRKLSFHWGCEGRVDAVAVDELPIMVKANCNFLAFGVEAGTQKVLDRLNKNQTLEQVEFAIKEAKKQGVETVHGFFLIGSPDETIEDIKESFRFAAKLNLDTFGFNRLCAYRGTPLWQEYVDKGIIDDQLDWNKWFKCSDIDPSILPSHVVNQARKKGYLILFGYLLRHRPIQTFKLLRKFGRYMTTADIFKLLYSPFKKRTLTKLPDLPAKMIEQGLTEPIRET